MARWQIKCLVLVFTFGRSLDQNDLWGQRTSLSPDRTHIYPDTHLTSCGTLQTLAQVSRRLAQFTQRAARVWRVFEKPQATRRKVMARGIALLATWHASFTTALSSPSVTPSGNTGLIPQLPDTPRDGAGEWLRVTCTHENNKQNPTVHCEQGKWH